LTGVLKLKIYTCKRPQIYNNPHKTKKLLKCKMWANCRNGPNIQNYLKFTSYLNHCQFKLIKERPALFLTNINKSYVSSACREAVVQLDLLCSSLNHRWSHWRVQHPWELSVLALCSY
uniref:Uncharacterized protein n=1 Tax=Myripristis murdjan TaxID=586833 RepID=A0A667X3X5_9TELE